MSDLIQIQQQINKREPLDANPTVRADALQDEMLVDTMMEEANRIGTQAAPNHNSLKRQIDSVPYTGSGGEVRTSVHMLGEGLFENQSNDTEYIKSAIQQLSQLIGGDVVYRAFETGGDLKVNEIRHSLLTMVEHGLNPSQFQQFQVCSDALSMISGGMNANTEFDIRQDDIVTIKGALDSGIVAYGAIHAEVWSQDSDTLLAFQNLTQAEADEVQEELHSGKSTTISDRDRNRIKAMGVTTVEVEEVLVDFWEAAQNEEYQIVEDEDLK